MAAPAAELREILTPDEYRATSASITDAHYTAPGVVEAMRAARHFGFRAGACSSRPSAWGISSGCSRRTWPPRANGTRPSSTRSPAAWPRCFYPEANILPGTGFEDAMFADGVFDLAIGNPPFGDWRVKDKHKVRKHLSGLKIHNYIIAKAGMHLRPGGIMQMVVTHRFLDTANPEARDVLAKDFRFLGAIRLAERRLPRQRRHRGDHRHHLPAELGPSEKRDRAMHGSMSTGEIEGGSGSTATSGDPQHILDRSAMDGSMYGGRRDEQGNGEYTVHSDGRDLGQVIDQTLATDWKGLRNTPDRRADDAADVPVMLSQSDSPWAA